MKSITIVYEIKASLANVWQALTDPEIITEWGAGPAIMSDQKDKSFSLWGGDIHGNNIEVTKNQKLVQEWKSGNWAEWSTVIFTLKAIKSGTEITMVHNNIPDNEFKDIAAGWDDYYLGPMKEYIESES